MDEVAWETSEAELKKPLERTWLSANSQKHEDLKQLNKSFGQLNCELQNELEQQMKEPQEIESALQGMSKHNGS